MKGKLSRSSSNRVPRGRAHCLRNLSDRSNGRGGLRLITKMFSGRGKQVVRGRAQLDALDLHRAGQHIMAYHDLIHRGLLNFSQNGFRRPIGWCECRTEISSIRTPTCIASSSRLWLARTFHLPMRSAISHANAAAVTRTQVVHLNYAQIHGPRRSRLPNRVAVGHPNGDALKARRA